MIYTFGAGSLAQLSTCELSLQRVLRRALQISPIDFKVLVGYRNQIDQEAAFAAGTSTLHWPDGKHNHFPSFAADIAPVPLDWRDRERFSYLAGVVLAAARMESVRLRWGGDWNSDGKMIDEAFRDLGHFELALLPVQGGQ